MDPRFKMEYLKSIYARYHKADKEAKGRILSEFVKICGYHRKHAVRVLNNPKPPEGPHPKMSRRPKYGRHIIDILENIWRASGYLCSQRLKGALPLWLPFAKKRFSINSQDELLLLNISPRQMDNRLRSKKLSIKKRIYSTTRPGALLKSMIPVKTHAWDIKKPGFLEIDTVAHCGNSNSGDFIYTLNVTDFLSGWTERRAVMGKGKMGVLEALKQIKQNLPFALKGIDSDNGEEFINFHLLDFCRKSNPPVQFTRSRPYKKDDNAHIEQKNWTHVRKIFGWDRFDSPKSLCAFNDLYQNELRLFQNLFQPSLKLIRKCRIGSRLVRKYDSSQTPLQRLISSQRKLNPKLEYLKSLSSSLDPFALSESIDRKLSKIFALASKSPPSPLASSPAALNRSPWRGPGFVIGRRSAKQLAAMRRSFERDFKDVA
ncbi:MAG: integrase [Endomicrobiia bacterium]|nr:integrase [Endomicrobiia bacterium]